MLSRSAVQVGVVLVSALLAAFRFVGEWRGMSRHLPPTDPRVRRGWRLGAASAVAAVAGFTLHGAAIGTDWPGVVFGAVLGLYGAALTLFALAYRQFAAVAPPDDRSSSSR